MRRMREYRRATQVQWSKHLDCAQNSYSQKEAGLSTFFLDEVQRLCRIAEIDVRYAMGEMALEAADLRLPRFDDSDLWCRLTPSQRKAVQEFAGFLLQNDKGTPQESA